MVFSGNLMDVEKDVKFGAFFNFFLCVTTFISSCKVVAKSYQLPSVLQCRMLKSKKCSFPVLSTLFVGVVNNFSRLSGSSVC